MKLKKSTQFLIGGGILLFTIAVATSGDTQETKPQSAENSAASETVKAETASSTTEIKTSIGFFKSTTEFKLKFNSFCRKNSFDFAIKELEIEEGLVQNSLQYSFDKNLGLIASVDKTDGSVNEITMISQPDGTQGTAINLISMMAVIIGIADPSLSPDERGSILKELRLLGDNAADLKDHKSTYDNNGVHYFVTCSELTGIWFGASRD